MTSPRRFPPNDSHYTFEGQQVVAVPDAAPALTVVPDSGDPRGLQSLSRPRSHKADERKVFGRPGHAD